MRFSVVFTFSTLVITAASWGYQ